MSKIRVTKVRSGTMMTAKHRQTLQALGLIHRRSVIADDSEAIRGMIFQVRHLVRVEQAHLVEAKNPHPPLSNTGSRARGLPAPPTGPSISKTLTEKDRRTPPALGLKNQRTFAHLAAMADYHRARRGFPTDSELADILGVHRSRVADWKQGNSTPTAENARLLSHLAVVVTELESFLDLDVIPDWLATEQHTLRGSTPVEALREGRLAEVLFAANATEHGAYI